MTVLAHSSVSQPIRVYNSSGTASKGAPTSGTETKELRILEDGVVLGFLAFVNLTNVQTVGSANLITVSLSRNGQTLTQQSIPMFDGTSAVFPPEGGLAYYETLNMLAGAEVKAGEEFKISVAWSNPSPGQALAWTFGINLTIKSQPRSYQI